MMIFFDIDDTLLDNTKAEQAAAMEFQQAHSDLFPGSPEAFAIHWRMITEKHVQRYLTGELSFQGQRRERLKALFSPHRILKDAEADDLFEGYLEAYEKNWTLFPDVLPCLERLRGARLGIISNGDSLQQRQKLSATGIIDRFSQITISQDVGVSKPDPAIFLGACEMAGVLPSECRHIGDNLNADVRGSLSAGLNGIWLNRNGRTPCRGILTIRSLSELKQIPEYTD